jgi:hypothetical protein
VWQQRVVRDRELLRTRLTVDQMKLVRGVVPVADSQGVLDFMLVFGSVARDEQHDESDLDVYFEAADLSEEYGKRSADYDVFGYPSGALLSMLRDGQTFAFNIARNGLIHADNGRYREALIAIDEEGLVENEEDDGELT